MNNIFLDCSIQHIKINRSDLYITRMHFMYSVNGEYSSEVKHIESDSPTENSLNALDIFNLKLNNFYKLFPNETFSSINIKKCNYRGFQVFEKLSSQNLIKTGKS